MELAERFRDYLLRLATRKMPKPLRSKLAPSDVLQEVFLEAWRDFSGFKGEDGRELLLWLRKILLHNLSDNVRRYYDTQKRQVSLEWRLEGYDLRRDEILSQGVLGLSPSAQAEEAEERQRLETALALLPDPYRRVILLRSRDGLDFASIGDRMERSGEAARQTLGQRRCKTSVRSGASPCQTTEQTTMIGLGATGWSRRSMKAREASFSKPSMPRSAAW